jgi:hypothetical protein
MPNLCRVTREQGVKTHVSVAAVVGQLSLEDLANHIRASCLEKGRADVVVDELRLPPLPREGEKRRQTLADNGGAHSLDSDIMCDSWRRASCFTDYKIGQLVEKPQAEGDYTVLFFSDPNEMRYEADFDQPLHMELKRGESETVFIGRRAANNTDHRPLFEKYQFFTPGKSCTQWSDQSAVDVFCGDWHEE